jgi:hypothetical protein
MKLFGVGVLLAIIGPASDAKANNIVTITYDGTIGLGFDTYNTWKTGTSNLSGDNFSLEFLFNLDLRGSLGTTFQFILLSTLVGDNFYTDYYRGVGDATLTINGVPISINGPALYTLSGDTDSYIQRTESEQVSTRNGTSTIGATITDGSGIYRPFVFYIPFSASLDTAYSPATATVPFSVCCSGGGSFSFIGPGFDTSGILDFSTLTVASTESGGGPSAIPLPTALPLFAGALGGLGVLSRWRRRRAA